MTGEPILQVEALRVEFPTPKGVVHAVGGVSFEVRRGQIFGIVGESGCGKSATGRAILQLVPSPGRITGGRILFHGQDLALKSKQEMQHLRGRCISMIFQDPSAALNPLFTIGQQLMMIMKRHRVVPRDAMERRAIELLNELGLPHPEDLLCCYPHQLSGGMKQRAMIGMALSTEPDLIIADEPTSALDVTIQSQILDLLVKLQREREVGVILITHDLGVVAETCDQVAVFYRGQIVEEGETRAIFADPKHPYTRGLMAALPTPSRWGDALQVIPGTVPANLEPIVGCPFTSRCEYEMAICQQIAPPAVGFGGSHQVLCHLYGENGGGR